MAKGKELALQEVRDVLHDSESTPVHHDDLIAPDRVNSILPTFEPDENLESSIQDNLQWMLEQRLVSDQELENPETLAQIRAYVSMNGFAHTGSLEGLNRIGRVYAALFVIDNKYGNDVISRLNPSDTEHLQLALESILRALVQVTHTGVLPDNLAAALSQADTQSTIAQQITTDVQACWSSFVDVCSSINNPAFTKKYAQALLNHVKPATKDQDQKFADNPNLYEYILTRKDVAGMPFGRWQMLGLSGGFRSLFALESLEKNDKNSQEAQWATEVANAIHLLEHSCDVAGMLINDLYSVPKEVGSDGQGSIYNYVAIAILAQSQDEAKPIALAQRYSIAVHQISQAIHDELDSFKRASEQLTVLLAQTPTALLLPDNLRSDIFIADLQRYRDDMARYIVASDTWEKAENGGKARYKHEHAVIQEMRV